MREFKTYNPIVIFAYFLLAIGFSMFIMHPVLLLISLMCSLLCGFMEAGAKKILRSLTAMIPFVFLTAVINPLFNHKGATILAYFPSGNPLTAESIFFGVCSAVMFLTIMLFFLSYNRIVTSDKFLYIFGKFSPAISLVTSMTLRFIPKMSAEAREIVNGQKSLGRDPAKGNIIIRCKRWVKILSILITKSLENSIETSDSMRSRGYGVGKRTTFQIFGFESRDAVALIWMLLCGTVVIVGIVGEYTSYSYFPVITVTSSSFSYGFYAFYSLLMLTPVLIEGREKLRWIALK